MGGMRGLLLAGAVCAAVAAGLTGCSDGGSAPTTPVATATTLPNGFDLNAAQDYCTDNDGTVQSRQPTYGTNGDKGQWVKLGEPITLCRFQADDEADSRLYVDLVTLYSERPTLAALAYLAKAPLPESKGGANPAAVLCGTLGGATDYGAGVAGGGLVSANDKDDTVVAPCVFADQSFIDEWGIAYYSAGTVRGTDLAKLFRFDVSKLPPVFAEQK